MTWLLVFVLAADPQHAQRLEFPTATSCYAAQVALNLNREALATACLERK